jgi:hypothetical protein
MGASTKKTVVSLIMMLTMSGAYATRNLDGTRTQSVTLSADGRQIDHWTITSSEIHRVRLPHGFQNPVCVGMDTNPASAK